jgi:hypothetical protein
MFDPVRQPKPLLISLFFGAVKNPGGMKALLVLVAATSIEILDSM